MQVYTRYKVIPRSRRPHRGLYGFLALTGALFLVWAFWHWGRPQPRQPARVPSPSQVASTPATTVDLRPPAVAAPAARVPSPAAVISAPPPAPPEGEGRFTPRPAQNVLEAQWALGRRRISCGSLDGVLGNQTRAALAAFQRMEALPPTGTLDLETRGRLVLDQPPLVLYTITTNDLARLLPISPTWLGKSEQPRLDFESALELVAETSRSHPSLIRQLNPGIDWTNLVAGTVVQVPNPAPAPLHAKAAFIEIALAAKSLEVFDAQTNLIAHFPCSIARLVEKRPVGELHVAVIVFNPDYTFDPEVFPESTEARRLGRKLILPPGPNNPVGTAWIGLDRPGYGIHGSPRPEEVGRTESHGCFRLANWNAELLAQMITIGTPVVVEP